MMENPIKMDDLGVPVLLETPIYFTFSLYFQDRALAVSFQGPR